MRVLVACEYSGIVRDAFRSRGHDAFSCDILPSESSPEYHFICDVREVLDMGWDLMIAHPPCTHLSSSGSQYWGKKLEDGRMKQGIEFFLQMYYSKIPSVCVENPVGIMSSVFRRPDQIIQPYMFGEPIQKRTALWLRNLSPIAATKIVRPVYAVHNGSNYGAKRKDGTRKMNYLLGGYSSGKKRSRFFTGIAAAMADQWGMEY